MCNLAVRSPCGTDVSTLGRQRGCQRCFEWRLGFGCVGALCCSGSLQCGCLDSFVSRWSNYKITNHREDFVSFSPFVFLIILTQSSPVKCWTRIDPGKASLARFAGVMITYDGKEINVSINCFPTQRLWINTMILRSRRVTRFYQPMLRPSIGRDVKVLSICLCWEMQSQSRAFNPPLGILCSIISYWTCKFIVSGMRRIQHRCILFEPAIATESNVEK